MAKWLAALDQGTTSTRCMIFDERGGVVVSAQKEHRQIFPRAGWVEHDPVEIWRNAEAVIAQAVAQPQLNVKDCAGIGITNQRETTVVWNKRTGVPVCNAIVWQDTRVNELVARFTSGGHQDRIRAVTGLPLASYFSALKLQWILDNVPSARAQAEAGEILFGTIDTWLLWKLCGLHLTDVTNASRIQLMNLSTLRWDDELLALFRIPQSVLPQIVPSSRNYGAAKSTALKNVPVAGILGDQQAALVGQACFKPGEAKNTYGTGCFMLLNTGEQAIASKAGLLTTLAYQFGDSKPNYALEGSIAIAGALVQWLRDNLQLIATSGEIEALAKSVEDNGDVYFVPAFSGLYAPYWREDARGVIAGLTRFANRGHVARAALEAVAYQTRDVLAAMAQDSGIKLSELRVDGGMVVNELLMQFQADMLDVPVVRPQINETTALGAAYAAGLATGVWRSLDELRSQWREARRWNPTMKSEQRERLYGSWQKAVQRSFDWIATI
ncbi:MAG TPA: glycerol kinase GlpK [Steroidobacteraceae bacterium]|nr:glycerol kinase GlpK [Steroidobacteraceae bacterium]